MPTFPPEAPASADAPALAEARGHRPLFALKHDDVFVVADAFGDILGNGDGLFRDDTRVLSRFVLTLGGKTPSLLGAGVARDNVFFTTNLTNRPLPPLGEETVPEGVLHVERARFLYDGRLFERLALVNFGSRAVIVRLALSFAADFRDMFEVRGSTRASRGATLDTLLTADTAILRYRGLDRVERRSCLCFSEPPASLSAIEATFEIALAARERREVYLEAGGDAVERPSRQRFRAAAARSRCAVRATRQRGAAVRTSGRLFNEWMAQSRADLALLTTELQTGPYPYAGIPWFSTPFGRDAIITSLQMLWLDPSLAKGVLAFLARHQATETSAFQDAVPGKIMHETRKGEMALLRELPFGRYYGGVDTTPLFVVLAGAYAARTGDLAFVDELWPSLSAAMDWIEGAGDSNGDGFVDYVRAAATGLANQGWKDSHDSVFHADGSPPAGPIALVEVQGYVFAALRAMADLSRRRGDVEAARRWHRRSKALRAAVESRFWIEKLGFYALALDGDGRPCAVRGSNAGHLLFSGLPAADRAARVTAQLLAPPFSSGWGIRTLAGTETNFNPMSYHNGSVWPHDTALCVAGLSRYGERDGVVRLMSGLFEAADAFGMRLPELFCGFGRTQGPAPIAYPVACLPQAWASGAAFMMLQSCLGLHIDGWSGAIHLDRPRLPIGIDRLTVHGLQVAGGVVDLTFQRAGRRVVAYPEGADPSPIPIITHA